MNLEQKEFRTYPFEIKQMNDEDPNFFVFEGYASTFGNIDLGDDVVERGAFTKTLQERPKFKILWQHNMNEPIGVPVEAREDNVGLFLKARLPKEDSLVKGRIIPQIKVGSVDSMSIGFFIKDYEIKEGIRHLKEVDLFETSLVTMPMNPKANLTGFKAVSPNKNLPFAPRDTEWDSTAAIERIREYTGSKEEPSARYKKYFMFYDEENADKFGAYKLPFADIIDGEPHIVPRAIFAIAAALEGARGGVDMPAADKNRVIDVVNQCYRRMAKEFDDETLVSPLEKGKSLDKIESLKDIETTLKDKGFSNNESKTLISKIKEFSNQRDVEEKQKEEQRDAEEKKKLAAEQLIASMNKLTNNLNKFKNDNRK